MSVTWSSPTSPSCACRLDHLGATYDTELFGATMFMFMFWIFINLHHYFLDNVIWRRENPETGKFLFAHR